MRQPRLKVVVAAFVLAGLIVYLNLPSKSQRYSVENSNSNSNGKSKIPFLEKIVNSLNWLVNDEPLIVNDNENEILNNSAIAMDDPQLISLIRKKFILPPSTAPYNFGDKKLGQGDKNPSKGAVQAVAHILKTMTDDPFYVECGANDGEWGSNSIWLEKLGWKGILIEADAITFDKLQSKHRKAHSGHFCLSNSQHPTIVNFFHDDRDKGLGSSLIASERRHALKPKPAQCFPLYSVLLAMNRPTVDFFSLDIEGSELDILYTVPFDKVIFKVITIEKIFVQQGEAALRQFMLDQGYLHYKDVADDIIFIHPSVKIPE